MINRNIQATNIIGSEIPYDTRLLVCRSVGLFGGRSVCYNFQKGRWEVSLPRSYQSTCFSDRER